MKRVIIGLFGVVAVSSAASADLVTAKFAGALSGYNRSVAVQVASNPGAGGTFTTGPLTHTFYNPASGPMAQRLVGRTLTTFCIELQPAQSVKNVFELQSISQAPNSPSNNPNGPGAYGVQREARVNAIIGAAMQLGWMTNVGTMINSGDANTNKDRGAAIQLLIWDSVFESTPNLASWSLASGNFTATLTGLAGVNTRIGDLVNVATTLLGNHHSVAGLFSMTSVNSQDQVLIVPLPPAVLAGGLGLAGVAFMAARRKRLVSMQS